MTRSAHFAPSLPLLLLLLATQGGLWGGCLVRPCMAQTQTGQQAPGGNYTLSSPNDVLYDMKRGLALAQGDVTFTYREFVVRGDRGVVDYNTNKATLTGNLTVTAEGQEYKGRTLIFNLDNGHWTLSQVETVFPPDYFEEGTVLQPIYARGASVEGVDEKVRRDRYVDARGSNIEVSSCDRGHYHFRSKRLEFERDRNGEPNRIVLRRNALYLFGRKVLPLPVYVIRLTGQRRSSLQSTVGQNDIDGFFVKSLYDLGATEKHYDSVLIDALQKRGLGLGFQREFAQNLGFLYLYALSGKKGGREIDARVQRDWQLSPSLRSSINFQSTKNNSFGGQGVASRTGDVAFYLNRERVQTALNLRYNGSTNVGFGEFENMGTTLTHRQEFGKGWSIDTSHLFSGTRSAGVVSSSTLDNQVNFGRRGRMFDAYLLTELHDDLSRRNQIQGAYQLERVPELTLRSDTDRLRLPWLNRILPGEVNLMQGSYNEPISLKQLSRTYFSYTARPQPLQMLRKGSREKPRLLSEFTPNGRFEQAFYSDNTAKYNYDYLFNWNNVLGPFSFQANYFKQKTLGFTPFQFDFLGPSEFADATLGFQPSEKFRLNLSAGKDLQNGFERDVIGSLQFAPSRSFYSSLGFSYSPETKIMGDILGNFRLARNPGRFLGGSLDLGLRYTPQVSRLTRVNLAADVNITRKTRLQALTGYDGFNRRFDFNQFRVIQDMHCFNLYVSFDQARREVRFDLALKAFPFLDTRMGQTQYGEGFDPFVGGVQ